MTVGWILEGDLDAFYESTETTPDPGPARKPSFLCPFCKSVFPNQLKFNDHIYGKHHVERPFIILHGHEPTKKVVLRSPLVLSEITVANTSHAKINLDGTEQTGPEDELKKLIAETSQAELKTN